MSKKMLLHVCCAACLLRYEESGGEMGADLWFYNPNIYPRTEYDARREAVRQIAKAKGLELIIPDYQPSDYFAAQKKLWQEGKTEDRARRCLNCFYLRLGKTAEFARENGYPRVSSTMLASKYLNHDSVERVGREMAEKWGIKWVGLAPRDLSEFHPKGFYQQNFCGCLFSLHEKTQEKYFL
ncbi:epoxyqueuosine reductase QueH [Microgenomates group bacterium]|nr:epoxyqueuosine reductase QueH [Microgenomates group bacterium]